MNKNKKTAEKFQNSKAENAEKKFTGKANSSKSNGRSQNYKGKQGKKDSSAKRVNFDNAREDKVEKDIAEGMAGVGRNSIEHFNKNPEFLRSAGTIPFASILGSNFASDGFASVPGIMVLDWAPSYGYGEAEPLNQCAKAIYSYIVHANSRNYKYNSPDLMMQILAGIDVFCAIKEAQRLYGVAKSTVEQNRYTYDKLMMALGFDPDDIRQNLGDMWFDINDLIIQSKQLWVPNTLPILDRWLERNEFIYTDATGPRAQIYIFRRSMYYEYNEYNFQTGSSLVQARYWSPNTSTSEDKNESVWFPSMSAPIEDYVGGDDWPVWTNSYWLGAETWGGKRHTWLEFKSMIQNMLNKLLKSEDRGDIYGDMLNAYGAEKIFALPEFPSNYTVLPVYNAEILMQIENATPARIYYPVVTQTERNNMLIPIPQGVMPTSKNNQGSWYLMPDRQILNMHIPGQPSPELVMLATRYKAGGAQYQTYYQLTQKTAANGNIPAAYLPTTDANSLAFLPSCTGSEIIQAITAHRFDKRNGIVEMEAVGGGDGKFITDSLSTYGDAIYLMPFDWHPFIYEVNNTKFAAASKYQGAFFCQLTDAMGDFDNYIVLEPAELKKLHDVAFYSLFDVPMLKA